jgi:hypothetical protein
LPALSHPAALPHRDVSGGHQPAVAASDEPVQQLPKKRERHEKICPLGKLEQERYTQTESAQNRHQDEPGSAT